MKIYIERVQDLLISNYNIYYKLALETEEFYLFKYLGDTSKRISKKKLKDNIKRCVYCCKLIIDPRCSDTIQIINISKEELIELLNEKLKIIHNLETDENNYVTRSVREVFEVSKLYIDYILNNIKTL